MDGDPLYSIGDLARRTGLAVKTVRFYSDRGIVPPATRSPAGHRMYDLDAVARPDLVRTLRELGLDLPTIRKVVHREVSLPEVAAAHAEALAVQIRTLRLRRAVVTAVARRGSTPEELELMHKLAKLSADERRRLIDEFLDTVFSTLDSSPCAPGYRGSRLALGAGPPRRGRHRCRARLGAGRRPERRRGADAADRLARRRDLPRSGVMNWCGVSHTR
jgi:DNA-binding transcriptional MerR regulator